MDENAQSTPDSAAPPVESSPAAPTSPTPVETMTADDVRSRIVEKFNQFKPSLEAYHEYAQQVVALSIEYHSKRFAELGLVVEEGTLVATLDARQTPKSLDSQLAQLAAAKVDIKRIVFDRARSAYHVFK